MSRFKPQPLEWYRGHPLRLLRAYMTWRKIEDIDEAVRRLNGEPLPRETPEAPVDFTEPKQNEDEEVLF